MKKYLTLILVVMLALVCVNTSAEETDRDFQERVWQAMEELKSRGPVNKERFVGIDSKKVIFPHKRHQKLIEELGKSCKVCHHKQKTGKSPRACRRCHATRTVTSKGKYARAGKKLRQKDIFHLLCGDCHAKMLKNGYRKLDGSLAKIPSKCHHCHEKKDE